MTRSGSFRFGVTPSNAASKVFFDTPLAFASGHRSSASQARNWSSIFAAEAGIAEIANTTAIKIALSMDIGLAYRERQFIADTSSTIASKHGPRLQRGRQRALVEVIEFAADRHAMRQTRH